MALEAPRVGAGVLLLPVMCRSPWVLVSKPEMPRVPPPVIARYRAPYVSPKRGWGAVPDPPAVLLLKRSRSPRPGRPARPCC
ncbi:hypothetical protein NDU88_001650 [Pleurodeles waltl]|uniref:Secreted protein n=1 Tax=Pleurodeles waltl TaxID=8319 RepID=A0AAV7SZU1_PLEWA|nr:hypothetical protein NDU88_001650 [Pleurodeles waltl]